MTRVSASAIPRLLACPGSAHLRHVDEKTAYAEEGQDRHAEAETSADLGNLDELPEPVRKLLLPGDVLAAECSLAYDVSDDAARELGHLKGRDYRDLRPFEIPGTIDLLIRGSGRIIVVDYKLYLEVDPAAVNAQVATYALMVARAYGYLEVTVAIIYLGAEWRPADVAVLSAFDLDVHADRLRTLAASSDRSLHMSRHCKHCPAFHDCPEQRRIGEEAAGGALAVRVEAMIPFERDDDARRAYELRGQVRLFLQRLEAALFARAAERPIPLGGGRMWGKREKPGNERLDGDITYQVVRELHGQEVADAAVARDASKAQIKRALKAVPGVKVAPAERAVLAAVAARGGITRKPTESFEEFTPELQLAPASNPESEPPTEVASAPF